MTNEQIEDLKRAISEVVKDISDVVEKISDEFLEFFDELIKEKDDYWEWDYGWDRKFDLHKRDQRRVYNYIPKYPKNRPYDKRKYY